jgi:hypothetical protein
MGAREMWTAYLDVVHQGSGGIQSPHQGGGQPRCRVHARAETPSVVAELDAPGHQRRDGAGRAGAGRRQRHLDVRAAACLLELARGPFGDHHAVVDDDDAVGQGVGLVEVLRGQQDRGPLAGKRRDDVPYPLAAGRVQPGRRLVEEQHRRPRYQRCRQVEPAAHATGVALHDPVGRVGQLELGQQSGRPGP